MALRDTIFLDKWVEVYVPSVSIPAMKQACRQMGIEFKDGEIDKNQTSIHVFICTYSQLVLIGSIAGIDSSFKTIKNEINGY